MKIIFLSQDGDIEELVSRIGPNSVCVQTEDEVIEYLEDVEEDEQCLLFLDFDINKKSIEKFNKSIVKNDWIIRIALTSTMSVRELKKHQKGKTSTHGYLVKPMTLSIFKSILNDLKISHLIDSQDIFEEGGGNEDEGEDEGDALATDSQVFDPQELKVSTEVRSLIDMHSVKGDRPPYEGELNDKIQKKFDAVFSRVEDDFTAYEEEDDEIEEIDLREETSPSLGQEAPGPLGGISLDLEDDELESQLLPEKKDEESVEVEEEQGELDNDLDFDLDDALTDDEGEGEVIDDIEPLEAADDQQRVQELEDLTQNRRLPSPEELAEFDEETGDFEIPDELMAAVSEDGPELKSFEYEDSPMDDNNEEDELEFTDQGEGEGESENEEQEGALDFSTTPEDDSDDSEEEGGLDFNLGDELEEEEADEEGVSSLGGLEAALDEEETLAPQEGEHEDPVHIEDSQFDDDELDFSDDSDSEEEELEKTQAINLSDVQGEEEDEELDLGAEEVDEAEEELDLGAEEVDEAEEELELGAEEADEAEEELDLGEETSDELDFGGDASDNSEEEIDELSEEEEEPDDYAAFGEETNPTMVMTEEIQQDLEDMVDEDISTHEFRPGVQEETGLMDDDDLIGDDEDNSFREEEEASTPEDDLESEENIDDSEVESDSSSSAAQEDEEGHLKITEDKIPPRFHEGEALRLQATIRQLREEREGFLKEIQELKRESKADEVESLGLKAELEEANIEISILKKRHTNEMEEMRYRLRLTDEKKLYAEERVKTLQKEFDRLQGKVRVDFNHIKQREKELESQLELAQMDSESQVKSRDKKILELKRKIDQLEFNMENIVIREQKSRDDKVKLEERLDRIMKTLRGSIEVLEEDRE